MTVNILGGNHDDSELVFVLKSAAFLVDDPTMSPEYRSGVIDMAMEWLGLPGGEPWRSLVTQLITATIDDDGISLGASR